MRNRLFFCFILLIGVSFLAKAQDKKEIRKAVKQHNRAVYLKDGWIRDPYIYLCEDGFYYLTGTTPTYGDTREAGDPYNLGLDHVSRKMGLKPSIVGYGNIWANPFRWKRDTGPGNSRMLSRINLRKTGCFGLPKCTG